MEQSLKIRLLDELAAENVNVLRVRLLCRENPGLIATAGLRIKIWTLLLLGSSNYLDLNKGIVFVSENCLEQQVLDADVHRTRSDVEEFRSTSWRQEIKSILQSFCLKYNIQYKQGMNEVLAPFIYIYPPPNGSLLPYSLFKAFMFRYLERYFCVDDSAYLYKSFRYFHLLLTYFDPQLATHLHDQEFPPELYSPQWFLTLYSRSLPLPIVLRLWDHIIAVDDPSFTFFVGLCLLRRKRDQLLLSDTGRIPEILQVLQFSGSAGAGSEDQEQAVDSIMVEAVGLYKNTPRCFLRNLRLCCVSSTELTPQPHPSKWSSPRQSNGTESSSSSAPYSVNMNELDKTMAVQAARSCFMMSAQELVDSVAPISSHHHHHKHHEGGDGGGGGEGGVGDFSLVPQQYVIIDIRSFEECDASGGGSIPRAIKLEPDFLNRPEAFEIWMQHFDGTRGCNIVIVDLPPSQWQGVALWRRLLLGDGDSSNQQSGAFGGFEDKEENKRKVLALSAHGHKGGSLTQQERDAESVFAKEEAAAASSDLTRPAVLLALALQRNSFSHVSVLDGGFPALVQQLVSSRGTAEPVVINHEPEIWSKFLKSTGREHLLQAYNSSTMANKRNTASKSRGSILSRTDSAHDSGHNSGSNSAKELPRKVGDLSPLEVSQIAFQVADRLQHPHMRAILKTKLDELMTSTSTASSQDVHEDSQNTDA